MERLMEHTIRRQLIEQQQQLTEQNAKIERLTALLERQLIPQDAAMAESDAGLAIVANHSSVQATTVHNNAPVTHITNNTITQNITVRPWGRSSDDRVVIPASMLRAAFTENPRLAEYCSLTDEEKVDAETAAPYVVEALVDLMKRAHGDPQARNVYLNPKRSDQVLVFDEASWKVLSLVEGIRSLFDSIAGNIHRIIVTDCERAQLPLEVQASASWVPNLYESEPDKFVAKARPQVAAHLTNMAALAVAH
jgi:hypothetical protein